MTRGEQVLTHRFVSFVPEKLEDGVVYVAIEHATVVHRCACGCGEEVVTPLSPTDWRLMFDGESISLEPSIGSWSLPCRSHYWITRNRVHWAPSWTQDRIDAGRLYDQVTKANYFSERSSEALRSADQVEARGMPEATRQSFWSRWLIVRR